MPDYGEKEDLFISREQALFTYLALEVLIGTGEAEKRFGTYGKGFLEETCRDIRHRFNFK